MATWTLKQLSHFVAVAGAPSLSEAARTLKISQPALTTSIRSLEHVVGSQLFDRSNRFRLTPLGAEFLPRARAALARMSDLDHELRLLHDGKLGDLRLGCGPTMADTVVGPALANVIRKRPQLSVSVLVREIQELPQMLRERKLELLVVDTGVIERNDDLTVIPVEPREFVLFCRKRHPLAGKRRVTREQFFQYPHVSSSLPPWAAKWLMEQSAGKRPKLTVECNHHAILKKVVEGSDAISAAPLEVIDAEIKAGRLAIVHLEAPPLLSRPGVVHIRDRMLSPAAKIFIEELASLKGLH